MNENNQKEFGALIKKNSFLGQAEIISLALVRRDYFCAVYKYHIYGYF